MSVCDLDQSKTHFQTITNVEHKPGSCVSFTTNIQVLTSPGVTDRGAASAAAAGSTGAGGHQGGGGATTSSQLLLRLACAVSRAGQSGAPKIQQVGKRSQLHSTTRIFNKCCTYCTFCDVAPGLIYWSSEQYMYHRNTTQ